MAHASVEMENWRRLAGSLADEAPRVAAALAACRAHPVADPARLTPAERRRELDLCKSLIFAAPESARALIEASTRAARRGEGDLPLALLLEGRAASLADEVTKAVLVLDEAEAQARATGDAYLAIEVWGTRAVAYMAMGDRKRALRDMGGAIAQARASGERRAEGILLDNLALDHGQHGELAEFEESARNAAQILTEVGDPMPLTHAIIGHADALCRLNRLDEAEACLRRAAELSTSAPQATHLFGGYLQATTAAVSAARGDWHRAIEEYETALQQQVGQPGSLGATVQQLALARALRAVGRQSEAEARASEAIDTATERGFLVVLDEALEFMASLSEEAQDLPRALGWLRRRAGVAEHRLDARLKAEARAAEMRLEVALAKREAARQSELLQNLLPASIAARVLAGERPADRHDDASVIFADLVHFTQLAERSEPEALVQLLDEVFSNFDRIMATHGLEKIKTIGDAYMAASGVPFRRDDHAHAAAAAALAMRDELNRIDRLHGLGLQIRIGLHCGPLIAGVIGSSRLAYDVWSDTVNVAARMEQHGVPGEVQVSESMARALADRWRLEPRGAIAIKGKGDMPTWLLRGPLTP